MYPVRIIPVSGSNDALFKFRNVSMHSRLKVLLHEVSGSVCEMEILAIMGDHESGKKELVKVLSDKKGILHSPYSGTITAHTRAALTNTDTLPGHFTVHELMMYYASMKNIQDPWIESILEVFSCDLADLLELSGRIYSSLNHFEKRMVKIAVQYPRLHQTLILDDPFFNFSGTETSALMDVLRRVASSGCRIIITVDNIRQESLRKVDHIILLVQGVPVYYGPNWKDDLDVFVHTVLKLKDKQHCFNLDTMRDYFIKMPIIDLCADKRFTREFQKAIPPYFSSVEHSSRCTCDLFCTVLTRVTKQQSLSNELYKVLFCLSLGVGVFSKHSHVAIYSQHYSLIMSFLCAHVFLGISRGRYLYKEARIYAFEQKQRFYSPYLYMLVQTCFDLCFDVFSSTATTAVLYLLLTAVDYGIRDHIPLIFMLLWGACMRLSVVFICQAIFNRFHKQGFGNCMYIITVVIGVQVAACGLLADTESMSKPFQALHFVSFPSHAYHAALLLLETPDNPVPSYVSKITYTHNVGHMFLNLAFLYMLRAISFTSFSRGGFNFKSIRYILISITTVLFGVLCSYAYIY